MNSRVIILTYAAQSRIFTIIYGFAQRSKLVNVADPISRAQL
jgi:hypothetical protein